MNNIQQALVDAKNQKYKKFAILIDPDKADEAYLEKLLKLTMAGPVDYFFVGGSLLVKGSLERTIDYLKKNTPIPVVIFPGQHHQIYDKADAILLLSLISGRNPNLLFGDHVVAAPTLKQSRLEILPTGYILIDGGVPTSVSYMSGTTPIPANKPEITVCTAMAGEMLGLKNIYLEAGSGALHPISIETIQQVRANIDVPIIVGGGISSPETAYKMAVAGADIIVVGNAIEKEQNVLVGIAEAIQSAEQPTP